MQHDRKSTKNLLICVLSKFMVPAEYIFFLIFVSYVGIYNKGVLIIASRNV